MLDPLWMEIVSAGSNLAGTIRGLLIAKRIKGETAKELLKLIDAWDGVAARTITRRLAQEDGRELRQIRLQADRAETEQVEETEA